MNVCEVWLAKWTNVTLMSTRMCTHAELYITIAKFQPLISQPCISIYSRIAILGVWMFGHFSYNLRIRYATFAYSANMTVRFRRIKSQALIERANRIQSVYVRSVQANHVECVEQIRVDPFRQSAFQRTRYDRGFITNWLDDNWGDPSAQFVHRIYVRWCLILICTFVSLCSSLIWWRWWIFVLHSTIQLGMPVVHKRIVRYTVVPKTQCTITPFFRVTK